MGTFLPGNDNIILLIIPVLAGDQLLTPMQLVTIAALMAYIRHAMSMMDKDNFVCEGY